MTHACPPAAAARRWLLVTIGVLYVALPRAGLAQAASCGQLPDQQQDSQPSDPDAPGCPTPLSRSLGAIEAYVTAPARWDRKDWALFGGSVVAIGAATRLDGTLRNHLAGQAPISAGAGSPDTLQDALPAAALFIGTWGYAKLIDDEAGVRESHAMVEAAALSLGTAEALGYLAGRERPDQSRSPNHWRSGGSSFPSGHATAAFAIGTVLAESGNPRYRWVRRALGYGVAGFTAYERLKHNAHWLSDTVAGAALGAASARFAMDRENNANAGGVLAMEPIDRGAMLTYTLKFH